MHISRTYTNLIYGSKTVWSVGFKKLAVDLFLHESVKLVVGHVAIASNHPYMYTWRGDCVILSL